MEKNNINVTEKKHGGQIQQQESALQTGGRLDVTFADEVCEVAETKTTYITDKLN